MCFVSVRQNANLRKHGNAFNQISQKPATVQKLLYGAECVPYLLFQAVFEMVRIF
jgi:hypothetical protein